MINIDDIKNDWNRLGSNDGSLSDMNKKLARKLASERALNYQQKLARSYRIGYIGFIFPLIALSMREAFDASIALCIVYSLFGLLLGGYDIWFRRFILKSDYTSLSVVEAIEHASKVIKYQSRATIISIMAMIMVLIPLFYEIYQFGDHTLVHSSIAGLIIGLAIGIRKYVRNRRNARQMLEEVKDMDNIGD